MATKQQLTVSHAVGPLDPPLSKHTTGSLIRDMSANYGHLPAVISIHQDRTITYEELDKLSSTVAQNLFNRGIQYGDKVAVCAGNRWEYPVLQVALGKLGAVLVPLNTAFTDVQFASAIKNADVKCLISSGQILRPNGKHKHLGQLIEDSLGHVEYIYAIGDDQCLEASIRQSPKYHHFDILLENPKGPQFVEDTNPDSVVNMQFTSGTTSDPKMSCLTHTNLVNNGLFIGNRMGLSATKAKHPSGQDHLCVPVPMFHCFGLVLSNLASFTQGSAVVYPSESFGAREALQALREYKCTAINGVPTMFAAELELEDEIAKGGFECLSKGIAAGSSVPIEMMRKLINIFNLNELTICYGMTETSPVSTMTRPGDPLDKRTSSVGTVMPHTEVMIVHRDDQTLTPLPIGTKGEIVTAGYLLQKEYYKNKAKTEEAMVYDSEGKRWMRTGDEGVMDSEGFVTVTGRIKDLIIRGGENIHPLEIENVLFRHPAVSQASVVGAYHEKYGEDIVAFIIKHQGVQVSEEELQAHVKKELGSFLTPHHVFFVDSFPATASGKIRKVELSQTAEEILNHRKYTQRKELEMVA